MLRSVRRSAARTVAFAAVAAAVMAAAPSAGATGGGSSGPKVKTIAAGFSAPLQLDVSDRGILVGQSFAGVISVVKRDGSVTDILSGQGVDGVAWGRRGSVVFTHTDFEKMDENNVAQAEIRVRKADGSVKTVADLRAHEVSENPDKVNRYGFQDLDPSCAASIPPGPVQVDSPGGLDSHPYAIAQWGDISIVADAGGNDILAVSRWGKVHTIAVLPPVPVKVTAGMAGGLGLPDCTVGATYNFEPVPTDVEIGPRGQLYVTTLPGGPEDGSAGAIGSVYKINPWSGSVRRIGTGFAGATNLAVTDSGSIYVAELYGGQVSKLVHGGPKPLVTLNQPAALEATHGKLIAGINALSGPTGAVVSIRR